MTNLNFFIDCFTNEIKGTVAAIKSLPSAQLSYQPHPTNKSARELVEHITCHLFLFDEILHRSHCDENKTFLFGDSQLAGDLYESQAKGIVDQLQKVTQYQWEKESVTLLKEETTVMTVPRYKMMWIFLFDTIHHRGQLSSYIRPMGGKYPAIYGSSADTLIIKTEPIV